MPASVSPLRTAGFAAAGFALLAAAYLALAVGFFGGAAWATVLGYALGAAGIACGVAAVGQSLRRWQLTGRAPVAALVYAVLGVAALVWWARAPVREAEVFQEHPDALSAEVAGDGIDVRDARGLWHVSFAGCPAAVGASATRSHDGIVEVLGVADRPVMRLHVSERRVECLQGVR